MATLRTIRRRIGSIRNTQQITKAMKMVAAAKLKGAQGSLLSARPYSSKIQEVVERLVARTDLSPHPLLEKREIKRVVLIVVSSDRGLCGAFNANIFREAMSFLKEKEFEKSLMLIGKKAQEFFKRRDFKIKKEYKDLFTDFSYTKASEISQDIMEDYVTRDIDGVYIIYNYFKSVLFQKTIINTLLPFECKNKQEGAADIDYIYEPSELEILKDLLPRYIKTQIFRVLLESIASEYSARMTAMDAATENAAELTESLTLTYNKARQAAITKEIIEVVSGADAMKG